MSFDRRMIVAAFAMALSVGCTPTDVTLGNAVRTTMAAQIVDPDPQYEGAIPTTDATKASAAVDRYRSDQVKKPDTISTTQGQSNGPN